MPDDLLQRLRETVVRAVGDCFAPCLATKGRVLSSGHSVCTSGVDDTAHCASDTHILQKNIFFPVFVRLPTPPSRRFTSPVPALTPPCFSRIPRPVAGYFRGPQTRDLAQRITLFSPICAVVAACPLLPPRVERAEKIASAQRALGDADSASASCYPHLPFRRRRPRQQTCP